ESAWGLCWWVLTNAKMVFVSALVTLGATGGANSAPAPKAKTELKTTVSTNTLSHSHTNRLAREKSPYLLQHAHNPVDWYPWGEEAFARARTENKPIFLSI